MGGTLRARPLHAVAMHNGVPTTWRTSWSKKEQPSSLAHIHTHTHPSVHALQDAVKELQPGQAVACVKDPTNPHDPHAVRVETAGGTHLGYVPRDLTRFFPWETCFGAVVSVGPTPEGDLWGAQAEVRAALPGVEIDLLPPALAQQARQVRAGCCLAQCCGAGCGGGGEEAVRFSFAVRAG